MKTIVISGAETRLFEPSGDGGYDQKVKVAKALVDAWGENTTNRVFSDAGLAPMASDGMRYITRVVPPVVNVDKPWYEYGRVYGPHNGHPDYAADWNLESMGNTDKGEPICSPFDGVVINSENYGGAWGNIIRVMGIEEDGEGHKLIVWMGAHFRRRLVKVGDVVAPGGLVGEIGTAGGQYSAHLHEQIAVGKVLEPTAFVFGAPFVSPFEWYKARIGADLITRLHDKDNA